MKRSQLLVLLSIFLMYCQKDENPITTTPTTPTTTEDELLSLSIPDQYYPSGTSNTYSGHVYLTDESGEIITSAALSNNNTSILKEDFDFASNSYNATILRKTVNSAATSYNLHTFLDIQPYQLEIKNSEYQNPNNERAIIVVLNPQGSLNDLTFNNSYTAGGTGDAITIDLRLNRVPENLYSAFQNSTESFSRYIWVENATGATNDSLEHDDIPILDNSITINYPDNQFVNTDIEGSRIDDPHYFYTLSNTFYNTGSPSSTHYLPENLFDIYKVSKTLRVGAGGYYSTVKTGNSIDLGFSYPDLNFEITDASYENFEITSTSDYNFFTVVFRFSDVNSDHWVTWQIHGVGKENINFGLSPKLLETIFSDHPEFSYEDFDIPNTHIHRFEGIQTYDQFIHYSIDANAEEHDLITESEHLYK